MRLLECYAENFGSYLQLTIDLSNLGLSLIYGKTGSGKSTVPDMACWALTGQTAKDGAADDVRSWTTQEPTSVVLTVETPQGVIDVYRTRGKGGNDLFWCEPDGTQHRGKDLTETQKLLNKRLGIDSALYMTAAYFCEFSPTAQFFLAQAKDKREVFERIADLDLPVRISEGATEGRKEARKRLQDQQTALAKAQGSLEQLQARLKADTASHGTWDAAKGKQLSELRARSQGFDLEKTSKAQALTTKANHWDKTMRESQDKIIARIEALDAKIGADRGATEQLRALKENPTQCDKCGAPDKHTQKHIDSLNSKVLDFYSNIDKAVELQARLRDLSQELNPWTPGIQLELDRTNPYESQIESALKESNPFHYRINDVKSRLTVCKTEIATTQKTISDLESHIQALTQLNDLSFELRSQLLRRAIREIQESTNKYLEEYFDGEIRVSFTPEGSDSLAVGIQKSGYDCVYKQLSKGQRQMLKLCFVVSVMKAAANKAGIHFQNLFFDEALDGLNDEMKIKAFGLFQELETEHESVLVIDHAPEFQNLFSTKFKVTMEGDISKAERES